MDCEAPRRDTEMPLAMAADFRADAIFPDDSASARKKPVNVSPAAVVSTVPILYIQLVYKSPSLLIKTEPSLPSVRRIFTSG